MAKKDIEIQPGLNLGLLNSGCSYQLSHWSSGIGAEDRWHLSIDTVRFSGWIFLRLTPKLVNIYSDSTKTHQQREQHNLPVEEVGEHHLRSHQGQVVQGQCSLPCACLAEHSHAHHRHQAANKGINVSFRQLGRVRNIQEPTWLAVALSAMHKQ